MRRRVRLALCFAACLLGGTASADDPWEFWPEVNAFVRTTSLTRVFLDAAYAKGKEADTGTLDAAAYLDISIKPVYRPRMDLSEWARGRYLWARIGYDHVFKREGGTPAAGEDRLIASLWAKAPLVADAWLEARVRADLRWIDGDYSTRYRIRAEATREFSVRGHPVVPYFNVEWFYDTRYDGWARVLYQVGPEVTVNKGFRFEVFLARQEDKLPQKASLNAFGVLGKWYF